MLLLTVVVNVGCRVPKRYCGTTAIGTVVGEARAVAEFLAKLREFLKSEGWQSSGGSDEFHFRQSSDSLQIEVLEKIDVISATLTCEYYNKKTESEMLTVYKEIGNWIRSNAGPELDCFLGRIEEE